jgi:hypothetical protein
MGPKPERELFLLFVPAIFPITNVTKSQYMEPLALISVGREFISDEFGQGHVEIVQ